MTGPAETATVTTPEALATAIYDGFKAGGLDLAAASVATLRFLTEAIVFAVDVTTVGDATSRAALLAHISPMIAAAPPHPAVAARLGSSVGSKKP